MRKLTKRQIFSTICLVLLLTILLPSTFSSFTAKQGVIYKTSSNNAQFAVNADLTFYKVQTNSTHLWLDKTYSYKHYTRYCIWVQSPNNAEFTINSWFATANSTGQLTITSPLATNITLHFHSPNLISASATGVITKPIWTPENQTLSIISNSDADPIVISATVNETAYNETPPENYEVIITDLEANKWVFAEEKYYTFQAKFWDGDGYQDLDMMQIAFTDGNMWINASYDGTNWRLNSGEAVVNLKAGSTTILDSNLLQVTFPIYFESTILDTLDVDIYMLCNDSSDAIDGWDEMQTNYFNIYSLGGQAEYSFSGSAGHTTGGDVFEIWAGGPSSPEIFGDNFESFTLAGWSLYTPNQTYNNVEISTEYFRPAGPIGDDWASMHIEDAGTYTTAASHQFQAQTTTFSFTAWAMLKSTSYCLSIQLRESGANNPGPWVKFETDGNLYFVNSTSPYDHLIMSYNGNTWYNVTYYVNVATDTYDIYIAGSLKNSSVSFYQTKTQLDELQFNTYSGGVPTSELCSAYIDDVRIWSTSVEGYGGTAISTVVFRNLQHIHTQFAIGIPTAVNELNQADEGYVEFGIDYCINDIWVTNGWKVRINVSDANIAGASFGRKANNWIELLVSWYNRGSLVKQDTLYTFWEGGPGGLATKTTKADYFRLWLDLWFNKINASTTIGGRVNSYYYGMHDSANPWLQFLTGSDWGPMIEEVSQSMYFHDLEDSSGNVISCKQISMMRIRTKVWRSSNHDYQWRLQDFDILSYEQAPIGVGMEGIDTPIFVATKTPNMPQGGFLAALSSAFSGFVEWISDALGPHLLAFWDLFVGFLDTVFTAMGWRNGFSQILNLLTKFIGWAESSIVLVPQVITQIMSFITGTFTTFASLFVDWFTALGIFYTDLVWIWNNVYPYWGWVPDVLWNVMPLLLLFFSLWIISPLFESKSLQRGFEGLKTRLDFTIGTMWKITSFLWKIIDFTVRLIARLIESIPVAE